MPQSFRPYPEKAEVGTFNIFKFLEESILHGGLHFGLLVPHLFLPFYLGYMATKSTGLWTKDVQYAVDNVVVPGLQGLSLGGILVMGYLRYVASSGQKVAKKRKEKAATDTEERSQLRIEVAFWGFIYLAVVTILWQIYPHAEGPGVNSLRRTMNRIRLGIDLGPFWRPSKH